MEQGAFPKADDEWNAGHLGCGPLVLDLRKKLKAMPGGVLRVIALDISAPHDIPAWCRLKGAEYQGSVTPPDGGQGTGYIVRFEASRQEA